MEQQTFQGQMNRLAAAYRVDISAGTRAAYFLAFQKTTDQKFAAACERAIEHEKVFPTIAALKEILKYRHEAARAEPTLAASSGSVACRTCNDAGFVRLSDLDVSHEHFGAAIPCPHCEGARKPRNHHAEEMAYIEVDRAERDRLAPYREEHAKRFAPVYVELDTTPPPVQFVEEVQQRAAHVPVPFCITPFVIVPKKSGTRAGFVAEWANTAQRAARGPACDWCESREAVRSSMANRYADVSEVKG